MGGNAFTNLDMRRIKRGEIKPTLDKLAADLKIPHLTGHYMAINLMGSAARQADSGDLDIALDQTEWPGEILQQIAQHFRDNISNNVMSKGIAGGQLNVAYPILGDITRGYIQVDFINGPAEWLKFSHYSPGKDISPYKGVFISTLMGVLAKKKKDFDAWIPGTKPAPGTPEEDIDYTNRVARIGWRLDLGKGLHRKWQLKLRPGQGVTDVDADYFETHAPRILAGYGLDPNIPRLARVGYITDPIDVVRILLGEDITPDQITTFEDLYRLVKQRTTPEDFDEIKNRTVNALMRSGAKYDYPTKEALLNLPIFQESILDVITTSLRKPCVRNEQDNLLAALITGVNYE